MMGDFEILDIVENVIAPESYLKFLFYLFLFDTLL